LTAFNEGWFLKAIYLELKTDNIEEMKQKILAFGVKKVDARPASLFPGARRTGVQARGHQ
jgi:hypothetical protein